MQICHHVGIPSTPDTRNQVDTEPIKRAVQKFIRKHLPGVDASKPAIEEICMYTVRKELKTNKRKNGLRKL